MELFSRFGGGVRKDTRVNKMKARYRSLIRSIVESATQRLAVASLAVFFLGLLIIFVRAGVSYAQREESGRITADDFLRSQFARLFKGADYEEALRAIDELAQIYPEDPLVIRYRAIVLDQLGRSREALQLYDRLRAQDPSHVPTRFFMANAYYREGKVNEAVSEWGWVVQNSDEEFYRLRAKEMLDRAVLAPPAPQNIFVTGRLGWAFDSNVILKSNDSVLGFGLDPDANRYSIDLNVGYRLLQNPTERVRAIYGFRQSLHDDSLSEFNFMDHSVTLDAAKRMEILGKDSRIDAAYDLATGFLDRDLFSVMNQWSVNVDSLLAPRVRTGLKNQFRVTDFGPDGFDPARTSRDGFEYEVGVNGYVYSSDYTRYVVVGQDLVLSKTRGDNFNYGGTETSAGFHTPVPHIPRTDLDVYGSFTWKRYPDFVSISADDPRRRADKNWSFYSALTRRITDEMAVRVFYQWVNADNRNDFFQYDRHIWGIEVLLQDLVGLLLRKPKEV